MAIEKYNRPTSHPAALEALDRLFFILERLDIQAHHSTDGFVRVTAAMWKDMISPDIRTVRETLDADPR